MWIKFSRFPMFGFGLLVSWEVFKGISVVFAFWQLNIGVRSEFPAWFREVKFIARTDYAWSYKAVESLDAEAWRVYFDGGLSPADAWREEYSNA